MPDCEQITIFVKVKILFALILSIIIFTETVVPCCIWDGCKQEENTTAHKDSKTKADCSPFATCSTCVPAVLLQKAAVVILSVPKQHITHTPTPQYFTLSSYNKSLLQPPRFS